MRSLSSPPATRTRHVSEFRMTLKTLSLLLSRRTARPSNRMKTLSIPSIRRDSLPRLSPISITLRWSLVLRWRRSLFTLLTFASTPLSTSKPWRISRSISLQNDRSRLGTRSWELRTVRVLGMILKHKESEEGKVERVNG